jgi:hypothetical protein
MTILMCLSIWRFLRADGELADAGRTRAEPGGGVEPAEPVGSAS